MKNNKKSVQKKRIKKNILIKKSIYNNFKYTNTKEIMCRKCLETVFLIQNW